MQANNRYEAERLVEEYADMIYRLALIRTKSPHDAEDIMQEVFLRYLKAHPVFESSEHEKAWLIRVTVNRANSFLSSAWNRRTLPFDEAVLGELPEEEDGSTVLNAVASLPLAMRTAIHLHYFEQMTVKEISSAMGKSESAVKSLLFRVRQCLKELLEP